MGLISWLLSALAFGIPLWQLLPRAGLSRNLAFLALIPFAGLVLLWVIAFKRWPNDDVSGRFT